MSYKNQRHELINIFCGGFSYYDFAKLVRSSTRWGPMDAIRCSGTGKKACRQPTYPANRDGVVDPVP